MNISIQKMSAMSITNEILDALEAGISDPIIFEKYPWVSLPVIDRENILNYVQEGSPQSKNLLRLAARMALSVPGCDRWEEARILSLGILHMGWSNSKKAIALDHLKQVIDNLERDFANVSQELYAKCIRYKAGYWEANAQYCIDMDHLTDAISCFRQALSLFHQSGERKSEQRIRQQLKIYEDIEHAGRSLVSSDEIDNQRARAQKELIDLANQCTQKAGELEQLNKSLQDLDSRLENQFAALRADRAQVEQDIRQMRDRQQHDLHKSLLEFKALQEQARQEMELEKQRHKARIIDLEREAADVQTQIKNSGTAFQFLAMLSEHTSAPLWIEVVKLAVEQGEIDDLTLQALQRLSCRFPEVAGDLNAEVIARLADVLPEDIPAVGNPIYSWMQKLNQANLLFGHDQMAAAKLTVDAWQTFFGLASDDHLERREI